MQNNWIVEAESVGMPSVNPSSTTLQNNIVETGRSIDNHDFKIQANPQFCWSRFCRFQRRRVHPRAAVRRDLCFFLREYFIRGYPRLFKVAKLDSGVTKRLAGTHSWILGCPSGSLTLLGLSGFIPLMGVLAILNVECLDVNHDAVCQ